MYDDDYDDDEEYLCNPTKFLNSMKDKKRENKNYLNIFHQTETDKQFNRKTSEATGK